jgi:hypothetical protein
MTVARVYPMRMRCDMVLPESDTLGMRWMVVGM